MPTVTSWKTVPAGGLAGSESSARSTEVPAGNVEIGTAAEGHTRVIADAVALAEGLLRRSGHGRHLVWRAGESSVDLHWIATDSDAPDSPRNRADLVAAGEVLHLVRRALTHWGWFATTRRNPMRQGSTMIAAVEIWGPESEERDALLDAVLDDHEGTHASHIDPGNALLLLHDVATEHGVDLTLLRAGEFDPAPPAESVGAFLSDVWPPEDEFMAAGAVCTATDGVSEWLQVGEVAVDMRLTAQEVGLSLTVLSRFEQSGLRALVADSTGRQGRYPQIAFRVDPTPADQPSAGAAGVLPEEVEFAPVELDVARRLTRPAAPAR